MRQTRLSVAARSCSVASRACADRPSIPTTLLRPNHPKECASLSLFSLLLTCTHCHSPSQHAHDRAVILFHTSFRGETRLEGTRRKKRVQALWIQFAGRNFLLNKVCYVSSFSRIKAIVEPQPLPLVSILYIFQCLRASSWNRHAINHRHGIYPCSGYLPDVHYTLVRLPIARPVRRRQGVELCNNIC